jgi:hypothetical protein
MVGGLTNESHNARADAMVAYQEKNYPDLYQVSKDWKARRVYPSLTIKRSS